MRVCVVATELAGIGLYGGFGVATRDIAAGLARRGHEVYVTMPRQRGQAPVMTTDGLTVLSYPTTFLYNGLPMVKRFAGLFAMVDADVYHSQEPSLATRLAQMAIPERPHVVTCQDPRTIEDWHRHWAPRETTRFQDLKFLLRYNRDVGSGVRRADAVYCQAKSLLPRVDRMYRLKRPAGWLPNPVSLPELPLEKAAQPTVAFVGRWDFIKRPELFLDLARRFPAVRFLMLGACPADLARDATIRQTCQQLSNVCAPGWVDAERRSEFLRGCWVLVNTSTKECLPVSYLEAAAHKCAILSHRDTDGFATAFGHWTQTGDLDGYVEGLEALLQNDRWRSLGEAAYDYVLKHHSYEAVIDQHERAYAQAAAEVAASRGTRGRR